MKNASKLFLAVSVAALGLAFSVGANAAKCPTNAVMNCATIKDPTFCNNGTYFQDAGLASGKAPTGSGQVCVWKGNPDPQHKSGECGNNQAAQCSKN